MSPFLTESGSVHSGPFQRFQQVWRALQAITFMTYEDGKQLGEDCQKKDDEKSQQKFTSLWL